MSGSVGRSYLIGTWNNAAEYSGEMIGNRLQSSTELFLSNGKANIRAFADESLPLDEPGSRKARSSGTQTAFDKVCTADKAYERLMTLSDQLDEQLNDEEISFSDWTYARKQIDKKLDNAWQKLCSLRGWDAGEKDDEIFTSMLNDKVKQYRTASEQKTKQASSVSGVFSEAMYGLKDENVFKKLYMWFSRVYGGDRRLLSAFTNQ